MLITLFTNEKRENPFSLLEYATTFIQQEHSDSTKDLPTQTSNSDTFCTEIDFELEISLDTYSVHLEKGMEYEEKTTYIRRKNRKHTLVFFELTSPPPENYA